MGRQTTQSTNVPRAAVSPRTESLPAWIQDEGEFCCWRYEERDGKPTKVPYSPQTGRRGKSNDPSTFAALAETLEAYRSRADFYDGIGVGFFDNLCGIDIDHCFDEDGLLSRMAEDVLMIMRGAYAEISPSGKGLHVLFRCGMGASMNEEKRKAFKGIYYMNRRNVGLEEYVPGITNRFFTVTGNVYQSESVASDRTDDLMVFLDKYMRKAKAKEQPQSKAPARRSSGSGPLAEDEELLRHAMNAKNGDKFSRLWSGNWNGLYESHNEADLALCNMLAFWTQCDATRMDGLFRQSGLMREKWERDDYRDATIAKAIEVTGDNYYRPGEFVRARLMPETISGASIWENPYLQPKFNKDGEFIGYKAPSVPALLWWMQEDPGLTGIRLELMSQQIVVEGALPWGEVRQWRPVDDDYLFARMQERYIFQNDTIVKSDTNVAKALNIYTDQNSFDALIAMLESLPAWDGIRRADTLLVDFLGADDTPYTRAATRLLLRAGIARAYRPGCKYDYLVILEGPQGIGKSYLVRLLARKQEFFTDDLKGIGSKEAQELVQGRWFVELAELSAFKTNKGLEALKAFVTAQTDTYRVPYTQRPVQLPRRCVLVGTTNLHEYLEDPTGNRRFLPVQCAGNGTKNLFAPGVEEYIAQVWAEVLAGYRANPDEPLVLPSDVEPVADVMRDRATLEDPWIGMVKRYLSDKGDDEPVCAVQILVDAIRMERDRVSKGDCMRVSGIITRHCDDWMRCPSNRFIGGFGYQRAFVRKPAGV